MNFWHVLKFHDVNWSTTGKPSYIIGEPKIFEGWMEEVSRNRVCRSKLRYNYNLKSTSHDYTTSRQYIVFTFIQQGRKD